MNLLGISAVICVVIVVAGLAVVNALPAEEEQEVLKNCGSSCGNSCIAESNCGLSTCGAASCGCGK